MMRKSCFFLRLKSYRTISCSRDVVFTSSVLERSYSFTGIRDQTLTGPPVLNRGRTLAEYLGIKVSGVLRRFNFLVGVACLISLFFFFFFFLIGSFFFNFMDSLNKEYYHNNNKYLLITMASLIGWSRLRG